MKKIKFKLLLLLLFPFSILLYYLYSLYPYKGEFIYSLHINKSFIKILSIITGIFPFSLGEFIFYTFIGFSLFYIVRIFYKILIKNDKCFVTLFHFILNSLAVCAIIYFLFISMWGLNYLRPHFDKSLGTVTQKHTTEELANLYTYLIDETNKLSQEVSKDKDNHMVLENGYQDVFKRAPLGYFEAAKYFPSLSGSYGNPKPVFLSKLMNYTGIAGIYFPFTGEANVNIALPSHLIPATAMHEMAHQRGYANEDEANFISFLSCSLHPDTDFKYSGYLLALSYTSSALSRDNMELLSELSQKISPGVMAEINNKQLFIQQHSGTAQVFSNNLNNTYLKANGISDGTKSYGRMVDLLLEYYASHILKEN